MNDLLRVFEQEGVDILLRVIDDRVEMGDHIEQLLPHLGDPRADRALHLGDRILRRLHRARRNQVADRLGPGEVELSV